MRLRIFTSALNDVRYAAGHPLTVREFLNKSPAEQERLKRLTAQGE